MNLLLKHRRSFLFLCCSSIIFLFLEIRYLNNGFNQWIPLSVLAWSRRSTLTVNNESPNSITHLPLIYIITPTIYRIERNADLTRLSQTLMHVPRIHWIVVEDNETTTSVVSDLLKRCKLNFTHMAIKTPEVYRRNKAHYQRNLALEWVTKHCEIPSVLYFADDDNTYDLRLFDEVIGFASGWIAGRKFPIDMAGFAINSKILKRPNPPRFRDTTIMGRSESDFLEELNITFAELEPRADNCTKILVWHTRTEKSPMNGTKKLKKMLQKYNLPELEV